MYSSSSTQQPAAICALKSPADAIHILEAVRLGLVPRVTRRLTGQERSMIRPGTIWVWEEEETNMRRWTDGRRWGASRVGGGGFLVYTESSDGLSPPPSHPDSPQQYAQNGFYPPGSKKHSESLVKQTYSTSMTHPVTGKLKKFHVVAYSSKHNPQGDAHNPLPLPHQLPLLATLKITPGIWPEWEHRREADYARRQVPQLAHSHHHNQQHPSHHHNPASAPGSGMNTPEGGPYAPGPHSPSQNHGYPPRTGQDNPLPLPRYDTPPYNPQYYPPPRDPYAQYSNRPISQAPLAAPSHPGNDRFHPYHDASRSRPAPQGAYPTTASSSSTAGLPPTPSTAQVEYYDTVRGASAASPGVPFHQGYRGNPYPYGEDLSARPYDNRGPYQVEGNPSPLSNQWTAKAPIDPSLQQMQGQSTLSDQSLAPQPVQDDTPRIVSNASNTQAQNASSNSSHLAPPVDTAAAGALGKSPKMSIGTTLLNPHMNTHTQGQDGGPTAPAKLADDESGGDKSAPETRVEETKEEAVAGTLEQNKAAERDC